MFGALFTLDCLYLALTSDLLHYLRISIVLLRIEKIILGQLYSNWDSMLQSYPFDACDRTRTRQHTRH